MLIFDTKYRKKVTLAPKKDNTIFMYTCGPTVYNYVHIGNLRTFVFEDLLRRVIKFCGMGVFQVMNLTDVDDKTIKGATEKNISLAEFTAPFEKSFMEDLKTLMVEPAEKYPKATDFIQEMIAMILKLIKKDYAYQTDTDVFFRIAKFKKYGELSHLNLDELKNGGSLRVCSDEYDKENLSDFVLWKGYNPLKDGNIYWDSPFGKGRPGWHIECSCMSMHYLGDSFDLHTGGVDNIFPHHENEIAQSEACTNKTFARHWMHSEHLLVEGKKMSKSLGNYYTLPDLLNKGYSGREIRALFLSSHYRAQLNFTFEGLSSIRGSLSRIDSFIQRLNSMQGDEQIDISHYEKEFKQSLEDDLNTPKAFAVLFDLIRFCNGQMDQKDVNTKNILSVLEQWNSIFAFIFVEEKEQIEDYITEAANKRFIARGQKDYQTADAMRKLIEKAGYTVEDRKDMCSVKKKEI